jgi:hypothetical protein
MDRRLREENNNSTGTFRENNSINFLGYNANRDDKVETLQLILLFTRMPWMVLAGHEGGRGIILFVAFWICDSLEMGMKILIFPGSCQLPDH